jgi:hypothetical protein
MRRRKSATIQINVRLDESLVRDLETLAKANRTTISGEIRQRLIDSLDIKPEPSLADFRGSWLRRLRDAVETLARKEGGNIEEVGGVLNSVDAEFSQFYGRVETKMSPYVREPEVREVLRGASTLPNETKAKSKATQQE